MNESKYYHAHEIIEERCDGRLKCIRNCPTKALRVHNKKITFNDALCIDCGMCSNVCSQDVYVPVSDSLEDFKSFKFHVVLPSNILYAQFGPDVPPGLIQQVLLNVGFNAIADVSRECEEVGAALIYHLKKHPEIRPLISSFCPAVVRFIQVSYPNLVKHLSPLNVPRELVAKNMKLHYSKKLGLKIEDIGVTYISPCTAKMVSIKQPAEKEQSNIDGTISIKDIYNLILPEIIKIQQNKETKIEEKTFFGKAWGILGYFSQNVGAGTAMSVAGVDHVKMILDDIENQKLHNIDFVEALACLQGCANGLFCVKDPYVARHNSIQQLKKFSRHEAVDEEKVLEDYNKGNYFMQSAILPRTARETQDLAERIKEMKKKERIFAKLPKNDCSVCGAPTCETFAEDCARNEAEVTDCIFFSK
ncbi:MAG: hypothetical protein GY757_25955 [bacterium]|nr:hypothetical protein [bacterium]